jgi:hypothetical protein
MKFPDIVPKIVIVRHSKSFTSLLYGVVKLLPINGHNLNKYRQKLPFIFKKQNNLKCGAHEVMPSEATACFACADASPSAFQLLVIKILKL